MNIEVDDPCGRCTGYCDCPTCEIYLRSKKKEDDEDDHKWFGRQDGVMI